MNDYIFNIYYEGHVEDEHGYIESSKSDLTKNSDLTIDEFKYLKICYPNNINIYRTTDTQYIIILKNVDISNSSILKNICSKSKTKLDKNEWELCIYDEIQRCSSGTFKTIGDYSFIAKNIQKLEIRKLSHFEYLLLSPNYVINDDLELIDLNDTESEMNGRDHLYYGFIDKIYSNNITTLSYLMNSYENKKSKDILGKIKYLVSISDASELQKIHQYNGYDNPGIYAFEPETGQISEFVRCMISPQSNLGKPFPYYPQKKIVYETICKTENNINSYECYIDSGFRKTKNVFYLAIIKSDIKFVLECINMYINSMDMLCLAKLCNNIVIHDLIYISSNLEILKKSKFYDFYNNLIFSNKGNNKQL